MSEFPQNTDELGDTIPEPPAPSPAAAELDAGFAALDLSLAAVSGEDDESHYLKLANTRFTASIAVSLYELTQLLAQEGKS